MDNREIGFLDYNFDNIMRNLIATEIHLRDLTSGREQGHDSCCRKHLLFIENELGEAQSHSAVIKPELFKVFKKLEGKVIDLRKNLSTVEITDAINRVREIRKGMEQINPEYDTSNCVSCAGVEKKVEKLLNSKPESPAQKRKTYKGDKVNNVNTKLSIGGNGMLSGKEVGYIAGGNFLGKGVDMLAAYVDTSMASAAKPVFERPSTWISILGGLGLTIVGLKYVKDPNYALASTVCGTNLLTNVVDYAQEALVTETMGLGMPMALRVAPMIPNGHVGGRPFAGQ